MNSPYEKGGVYRDAAEEAFEGMHYIFFRRNKKWMVQFVYPEIKLMNSPKKVLEIELAEKEGRFIHGTLATIVKREQFGHDADLHITQ